MGQEADFTSSVLKGLTPKFCKNKVLFFVLFSLKSGKSATSVRLCSQSPILANYNVFSNSVCSTLTLHTCIFRTVSVS